MNAERRYVVCDGPPQRKTGLYYAHIILRVLDYLPDAYRTFCASSKRGTAVAAPTPEHPVCPLCSQRAAGNWHSTGRAREKGR